MKEKIPSKKTPAPAAGQVDVTKEFSKDYLYEELEITWGGECVQEDIIVETSRWAKHHQAVFEDDGEFWRVWYSQGLAEMQDEAPWEDQDTVTATKVEQREVVVKQWFEVKETQ